MKSTQQSERFHHFDSLRSIMMLLGVVLHVAMTYCYYDFGDAWKIKDPWMVLMDLRPYLKNIVKGVILILAVYINIVTKNEDSNANINFH